MGACGRCRSAQVSYGTAGPGRTGKNKREVLMEKFFGLKKHGTTVRTEILAGLTTFMAMAYILMVNANMFANPFSDGTNVLGVSYGAIYIATAISAVIGSVLIGLLSNLPLAQASGMGLNAFFVYTVCVGFGFTYANALVFVLVDGLIFILLTITGLRKKIFTAIPDAVRKAIPAGIGLFIAFLGLQNVGLVAKDASTGVTLGSFNLFNNANVSWATVMPMIVTVLALVLIAVLSKKGVRGAVLWGILGGAALYYVLGLTVPGFYGDLSSTLKIDFVGPFRDFGEMAFGKVFTEGFDFSAYVSAHGTADLVVVFITTSLAFCMVDMFDTLGTLYGACARGNMLLPNRCDLRHLHGHDVRRVLCRCCRGRQNRPCGHGDCCALLHRHVPQPHRLSHPDGGHRCGPHLCRRSDDQLRQGPRLDGSVRCSALVPHDGDDALHLQHLLRHRVRPDLLCAHPYLHRQDP